MAVAADLHRIPSSADKNTDKAGKRTKPRSPHIAKHKLNRLARDKGNEYLQKLYAQIGKAIYQQEKDNPDSIFAAECYNITERLQRIEELKTEAPAEEPVAEASVEEQG